MLSASPAPLSIDFLTGSKIKSSSRSSPSMPGPSSSILTIASVAVSSKPMYMQPFKGENLMALFNRFLLMKCRISASESTRRSGRIKIIDLESFFLGCRMHQENRLLHDILDLELLWIENISGHLCSDPAQCMIKCR